MGFQTSSVFFENKLKLKKNPCVRRTHSPKYSLIYLSLILGSLAKPNRTPLVREIRSYIRDGIRFYNRNGDVYLDCLANLPVFVQAPLYAHCNGEHLATVYRLEPGKPFDTATQFYFKLF